MNSVKLLITLATLGACCLAFSDALKCYTCTDVKSCKSAKTVECTAAMANQTRVYLDVYHKNVSLNTTSPYIECFQEYHKSTSGEFQYKGCIYSNMFACQLEMKDFYAQSLTRKCSQCNNKNGCNPAGRAELHVALPLVTVLLAALVKMAWGN